jgi:hypothetical protein
VVVVVVVRDRKRNPVTDLGKENFELLEGNVPKTTERTSWIIIQSALTIAPLPARDPTRKADAQQPSTRERLGGAYVRQVPAPEAAARWDDARRTPSQSAHAAAV